MRVRVFATLRDLMGANEISLEDPEPSSVRQALQALVARYPVLDGKILHDGEIPAGTVTVLVNGRAIEFLEGLETPLTAGDALSLFPPIGGGA